ncbi:MAG: hemolysin family protein [SAR202 cluster bacterium]|nr:hemolysin family protein [SAR202 cluster bacterium]
MIHAVVRLDTTVAREIMIPRVDIVSSPSGISIKDIATQMVNDSHSRIPIYKEDLDHIIGIAYARDILKIISENPNKAENAVDSLLRTAYFIPESKTLEELLTEFQNQRVQLAIVVDEYGGVSGLVTIEDLLEEIVGEIQDEFDTIEPEILFDSSGEFIIDARTSIEQLNALLSTSFEGEGFDTVGGLVYSQMGKIPSSGSKINYKGINIEVISTIGRRLKKLKISLENKSN